MLTQFGMSCNINCWCDCTGMCLSSESETSWLDVSVFGLPHTVQSCLEAVTDPDMTDIDSGLFEAILPAT